MATDRARALRRRYDELKQRKTNWFSHWDDLARLMLPGRAQFITQYIDGERRVDDIFDGTPMRAARGLANAIGGMLRPDGQRWAYLKAGDDDDDTDEGNAWLADTEKRLMAALANPKSRFRQATGEIDLDMAVLGTGILFVGEGRRLNHLLFQSVHLKDAVPIFDEEGNVEGLGREKMLTARQAEAQFGRDNVGEKVRKLLEDNKPDEKVNHLHMVLPRKETSGGMLARNLPVASIWLEYESMDEVQVGGFHEMPFICPRWDTSSGEDYGRSPGMIALPDAGTLQAMGQTFLVAGQRAADPPLMAPNDGTFSELNTFPGGISYYDVEIAAQVRGNPFFPLETGANLPLTREMMMDARESVFAAFFRNVLNLPTDGPQMTATEVIQRKEEFIREIGPVFGRLESDYTAPMVERAFWIMLRAGAFLPIPQNLAGRNIRFEYESPVKKIRQQIEAAASRLWVTEITTLAAAGKPEVLDLVDADEYGRHQAEAAAIPNKIVVGKERVEQIRRQRAQQQAAMQQAQMVAGIAEAAGKAAPMVKAATEARAAG